MMPYLNHEPVKTSSKSRNQGLSIYKSVVRHVNVNVSSHVSIKKFKKFLQTISNVLVQLYSVPMSVVIMGSI